MSPRSRSRRKAARGSGPDGRIEIGDIRDKLAELRGGVEETTESAKPYLTYAAVGGGIALIVLAFLLGRRRGRRKSTWVEIKRL
ncbi:MAG: hypothetical protein M0Z42_16390 [Actinomycetota bacterium]|nr:hypothetical protein [Actinomycetota bacterium]